MTHLTAREDLIMNTFCQSHTQKNKIAKEVDWKYLFALEGNNLIYINYEVRILNV